MGPCQRQTKWMQGKKKGACRMTGVQPSPALHRQKPQNLPGASATLRQLHMGLVAGNRLPPLPPHHSPPPPPRHAALLQQGKVGLASPLSANNTELPPKS